MHPAEVTKQLRYAGDERVGRNLQTGEAGDLAAQQRESDAGDVSDEHRFGKHRRQVPEAQDRTEHADGADNKGQCRHQCEIPRTVGPGDGTDT